MQHSRYGSQAVMRGYIRVAAAPEAFTSGALWRRKGGVTLTGLNYLPGKTPHQTKRSGNCCDPVSTITG
jgi:hypothetical protein